ncbi:hypothetical protein KAR91_77600 [Candidatus Pacearchaeota archaeon]|nr:hypothetical protein [Candidatus Pacearchaeota archaeon]
MPDQEVSYIIRARDAYSAAHKKADQTIDKTAKNVVKAGAVMTVAVAGVSASLFAMLKTTADTADEAGKLSARIGTTVEGFTELSFAAELSDVKITTLSTSLQRQTRRVAEAAKGTGEAKDALKELGLSAQALKDMAPDEQFMLIHDSLMQVESQADKVRLSMKLWDTEGVALLQMEDIRELRAEAELLGLTFDGSMAAASAKFNDELTRTGKIGVGIKNEFASNLIPFFGEFAGMLNESFLEIKKSGDFDAWSADVSEGVITSFTAMAEFITNVPTAWNATMVAVKTSAAALLAALKPVVLIFEKWEGQSGGFGSADMAKKWAENQGKIVKDTKSFSDQIDELAVKLLVSADANEVSGEKWAEWALKAQSSIDSVRNKVQEGALIADETAPLVDETAEGGGSLLAQAEADKIISIQQAKFQRIHEMAVEADLNDREMSALKLMRQLEEFEADRVRLEEASLLTTDLKAQFLFAEEEALLLHEQRLTDIETRENSKRIALEQNYQKFKFQTAVTGFGNLLILTKSNSKAAFRAVQLLNVGTAIMDSKAAVVGAYKHGASIGGPVLGAGYALAAAAANAPLISAITSASLATGGGGGGGGGGGAVPSIPSPTQDAGALIGIPSGEEARPIQHITLNIKTIDPSSVNWDNYSEDIVDSLNRAGKERDVKIDKEAVAR